MANKTTAKREIKPLKEMTEDIIAEKEKNGYSKRLYKPNGNYKIVSDEHKGETLANSIMQQARGLLESEERGRVNFSNYDDVRARTYNYFTACAQAETYPSVMGLAVHGFGISRQALNQFLKSNPQSAAAEFINRAKDVMADILTNASLYNNANAVQALFQLKNHFGHYDKIEIAAEAPSAGNDRRGYYESELRRISPDVNLYGLDDDQIRQKYFSEKYGNIID